MCHFKLARVICIARTESEPLCTKVEFREFCKLGIPQVLTCFAGWLIFELQVMGIANIPGITQDALAAGADWVQFETAMAAAQTGWLSSTSMRSLALLGRQDPGARESFLLFHKLSAFGVAFGNVLLLLFQDQLCRLMSNDEAVRQWLSKILWILALHIQTRISALAPLFLYIPLGKGMLQFVMTFSSFYLVACPVAGVVALTDIFTDSIAIKIGFCAGTSTIAQVMMLIFNFIYLCRLDWEAAGAIINKRANTDIIVGVPGPDPDQLCPSEGGSPLTPEQELETHA